MCWNSEQTTPDQTGPYVHYDNNNNNDQLSYFCVITWLFSHLRWLAFRKVCVIHKFGPFLNYSLKLLKPNHICEM